MTLLKVPFQVLQLIQQQRCVKITHLAVIVHGGCVGLPEMEYRKKQSHRARFLRLPFGKLIQALDMGFEF